MPFPQNFLDELLARSDIVDIVGSYVSLTPKGGSYWGCCPFHNEKTPSFHVLPDKQFYHCFGCKKGGGVVNFVMEMEGLTYPDAIRFLAKRANLPVPEESSDGTEKLRSRMLALNRDAARYYYSVLQSQEGAAVQAYLDKRRIRRGIAVRFGMGAAPDSCCWQWRRLCCGGPAPSSGRMRWSRRSSGSTSLPIPTARRIRR